MAKIKNKKMARKVGTRKSKVIKVIHVGFTAPLALVAKLQKQAKLAGISRASLIRNTLSAQL